MSSVTLGCVARHWLPASTLLDFPRLIACVKKPVVTIGTNRGAAVDDRSSEGMVRTGWFVEFVCSAVLPFEV
jgi:hypothetical protein